MPVSDTAVNKRSKLIAMLGHAPAIAMSLLPLANVLVSLLIWHRFRSRDEFTRTHLTEAVNFNLLFTLIYLLAWYVIPHADHAVARIVEIWMIVSATMAVFRAGRRETFSYLPSIHVIR